MMISKVAILVPICSRCRLHTHLKDTELTNIFLPSFVQSVDHDSVGIIEYIIYLGCDKGDILYDQPDASEFVEGHLKYLLSQSIHDPKITVRKIYVFEETQNAPCFVWNKLFLQAFEEGCDYFYQIGDDVELITGNWSSQFIGSIKKNNGIGVTGPLDVTNRYIFTQSFVGRKHMEIFKSYFPPSIKNWFSDNWITKVYYPLLSTKHNLILVSNGGSDAEKAKGNRERYQIERVIPSDLNRLINEGKTKITNFMQVITV